KLEMLSTNPYSDAPSKTSLDKLANFLNISAQRKCNYAWADTICINKESSAELDESIRSMYAWYRDSRICIVHLSETANQAQMRLDPWFTRGWTLQELLAPRKLAFYSSEWKQITRSDSIKRGKTSNDEDDDDSEDEAYDTLWSRIADITEIDIEDLLNFKPGLSDVRKKLTWVSKRKTTRIEDMAYCLLGIFDLNLSIAYGEKEKAFYRLQVEILQNSNDLSLFDWQGQASIYNSMLAASPGCFSDYLGLHKDPSLQVSDDPSFAQTNVGIRIPLAVYVLDEQMVSELRLNLRKTPTAFSILGASSTRGRYVVLLLGKGDHPRQFVRLALDKWSLDIKHYNHAPAFVFIK
ncbi:hypothetical protein FRC17_000176, partial [Serendipita sp. 399]